MKFGIEIEAKGMTREAVASLLRQNGLDVHDSSYTHRVVPQWKVVTDSSVYNGFEVVSPPLTYNSENIELVRRVIELLNESGCYVDKDCGIHVYIEVKHFTTKHIANIYNRYQKFESNFDSIMPSSRRANNNMYCKSISSFRPLIAKQNATDTLKSNRQYCRYYKVNLQSFTKYGTIEFRQMSGSLNKAKVAKWISLLVEFVEASKPIAVQSGHSHVSNNIRGKSRVIIEALLSAPHSASELATITGMTRASVQSAVSRLRKNHDVHISTTRGRYRMLSGCATRTETVDSFFKGISNDIKVYLERRRNALSA